MIESVDNLDRALGTVPLEKLVQTDSNKDLVNLYGGLKMTDSILLQTLKKHGLERFDPAEAGDMFNPNLHEATFQTKVDGKEDGSVFMTQQKGFILNGRVVRVGLTFILFDILLINDYCRQPKSVWSRIVERHSSFGLQSPYNLNLLASDTLILSKIHCIYIHSPLRGELYRIWVYSGVLSHI